MNKKIAKFLIESAGTFIFTFGIVGLSLYIVPSNFWAIVYAIGIAVGLRFWKYGTDLK